MKVKMKLFIFFAYTLRRKGSISALRIWNP